MSIRVQLLLVALTTLMLPWAGCQYARELETALRTSQENALEASAETIAQALSAEPARVFRDAEGDPPFRAAEGDLYVFALRATPLLDGYREDWGVAAEPTPLPAGQGVAARVQAGCTEHYLFLYLEVEDPAFVAEPADVHPGRDRFSRVDLAFEDPDGALHSYFFATAAPGPIEARRIFKREDGSEQAQGEPRIQAYWLQVAGGYHLEARVPLRMVGRRLLIAAHGADGARTAPEEADSARGGRLFMSTPGLGEWLATFVRAGTRATVIDANALKLGTTGSLGRNGPGDEPASGGTWYRRFVTVDTSQWPLEASSADRAEGRSVGAALAGRPAAEWLRSGDGQRLLLSAAAPITIEHRVRGAVVLEQAGDELLELRDRALAHLIDRTLIATLLALAVAFALASAISIRIGRLRAAADSAVGSDGRIRLSMPESARGDEIGALSRAFEDLLARLNEHTQYLRSLGGKLAHELRTPLSIVRSSLDNLESEGVSPQQSVYLVRAREGARRLQSILSALGAAARVEESIKQAERVPFDLNELLGHAVAGYQDAFPGARITLHAPKEACPVRGAPELVVQMLDKLIENAVDFCPPGGLIEVRLARAGANYELSVANDGPPIPAELLGRLFESLIEHRTGRDEKPHFGLGLYIARLIAEFHGGMAMAANRADAEGARFTVTLPMI